MKFPKILLISRSVPPAVSGSSTITGNLARQFTPDEMVVVGAKFLDAPPADWDSRWPKRIFASLHLPDGMRGDRWFRWAQLPWIILRTLWALWANGCQVILATYPDEVYLMAAYWVAVISRKPLFLYFHNTYKEHGRSLLFADWLQPRVFKRAQHVFVMSRGMQSLYHKYYPDLACTPLVHSFNEPLPAAADVLPMPEPHHPLRLALSGSINASNVGAAQHIAQVVCDMPDMEMTVYGRTSREFLAKLGFQGPQFHFDAVSRDELLKRLREADILYLPHGFSDEETEEEIQTVFPTRTVEYLIVGRPILAHVPETCFFADFLREHNCALLVTEPDVEALKQAVVRLKSDTALREQLVRNALETARQFHAPVVALHLRETLLEKLNGSDDG